MLSQKFIYILMATVAVILWMMAIVLSAGKAEASSMHSIAGYYPTQPWEEAKQVCNSNYKSFNYNWVVTSKVDAVCSIDSKKIIPPREHTDKQAINSYRHLQKNPAIIFLLKNPESNTVQDLIIVYLEPEPWIREKMRMASSKKFESIVKKVDTLEESFYSEDTETNATFFYFDDLTEVKERMYGISYWN